MRKAIISIFASGLLVAAMAVPAMANGLQYEHGGGQIIEGDNKISFGGEVNSGLIGEIQVNFHNVPDSYDMDKTKFHSTSVVEFNWFAGDGNCDSAMNATFMGRFNGIDGYELIFRAGDNMDTVRFTLSASDSTVVYDTYGAGSGFTSVSACVGTARTGLDRGNVTIFP